MKSIDIFPWDEHFNTGLAQVDEQHRKLVDLLNQLAQEVASASNDIRLYQIFDELIDYTVYHFETEEEIWNRYFPSDPMETEHKKVHQSFVDTVVRLKLHNEERSTIEIAEETLGFLARWLASHILETDRFMAYIVLAIDDGQSMLEAKQQAKDKMSGFTRTLIDLILSIYETLSTNTLQLMVELRKQKELEDEIAYHENELRIQEEYQRTVLNNFPFLVWFKDTEGRFLSVNNRFADAIDGLDAKDIVGKTDLDLWPHDLAEAYRADDAEVMQSVQAKSVEEYVEINGKRVWFETYKSPVVIDGIVTGTVGFARDITDRKIGEIDVLETKNLLATIIDTMPVRIFWKDKNLHYMGCNALFAHDSGMQGCSELIGKDDFSMGWADQAELYRSDDCRVMESGEAKLFYEEPQTTPDGETIWLSTSKVPIRNHEGEIIGLVGTYDDITERKESELKLQLAASVFTHAREGIMITTADGVIVDVNNAFTYITGYTHDHVIGKKPSILKSGQHTKEFYTKMWKSLRGEGHWYGEIWNRRANGEVYAQMITISAIYGEDGKITNFISLLSDITSIKEHQRQLEHVAHYDALTGLPNRVLLSDRLNRSMIQTLRRGGHLVVAYLDLDGFKEVNDTYGHEAGDRLLMGIAANMKKALREGDTLSRLGGDEFVAVLNDLDDMHSSIPTLERLLKAASEPIMVEDLKLEVSASLGVTFYPQEQEIQADQLLRQADQAMYQAKQAGKNRFHFFDSDHDKSVREQHESIEEIRRALIEDEFTLYYQPKVNMRSGKLIGAEALIRWNHPQRGLLSPAYFLPIIEDHPLSVELGEWVIKRALEQIEMYKSQGLDITISVNVSARQFGQNDFIDRLKIILDHYPAISPESLELEVLETSALQDMVHVSNVIERCKSMGIKFALDDFGTGYSSLTYLKHLPVSILKIDQSFVRDMLHDSEDLAILEGILGLGNAFRRHIIAEGVESIEQGKMLLQLGCDWAQGYAIARPMMAEDLLGWSQTWVCDPQWLNCKPIARDHIQILYAMVEHRSWVGGIESYVKDFHNITPPLDSRECRFGEWFHTGDAKNYMDESTYNNIDLLHEEVHYHGMQIVEHKKHGEVAKMYIHLTALLDARDRLNSELISLLNKE